MGSLFQKMFISMVFISFFSETLVLASQVSVEERKDTVKNYVVNLKKSDIHSVVATKKSIQSKNNREILQKLKIARKSDNKDLAQKLKSELDSSQGVTHSKKEVFNTYIDYNNRVSVKSNLRSKTVKTEDILVSSTYDNDMTVNPSMISTPDGKLWLIAEVDNSANGSTATWLNLYNSSDKGVTWNYIYTKIYDHAANASITYADGYIFIVYEANDDIYNRSVNLIRYKISDSTTNEYIIASGIDMSGGGEIYPEIATDVIEYPTNPYFFVTYAIRGIDYNPIYFSESEDYGESWSTPLNITGDAENGSRGQKPDIAFGYTYSYDTLYVAFEKLGLTTGDNWINQIWVTSSTDSGATWSTPVQLTNNDETVYNPRVEAANNGEQAIVAYTRDYADSGDLDIKYAYSSNEGSTWNKEYSIENSSYIDSESVELAVSHSDSGNFHAVYHVGYALFYKNIEIDSLGSIWNTAIQVDSNQGYVSRDNPKLAMTVDPTRIANKEACFAWSDFRSPISSYDVYFNRIEDNILSPSIILYLLN